MSDIDFNALLITISGKIAETELLRLKRLCRGKISTDGEINNVYDLLVDMVKCNTLGADKLDVLKEVLGKFEGGKPLLKDVKKFEEIRKEKMSGIVPSLKSIARKVGSGLVGIKTASGKLAGAVCMKVTFRSAAGVLVSVSVVPAVMALYKSNSNEDMWGTFTKCVLPAGAFLASISNGCLLFTVQAETLSALETLWKEYVAGTLQKRLQQFLVTEELKALTGEEDLEVMVYINDQEYKDALLDQLIKESNVNLDKQPQERCRRKSDSYLQIKPVETDVIFMRLRQVESRLLLERERRQHIESENKSETAAVSDGEEAGEEIYAVAVPETMKGMASGPSGLVEYMPDELNFFRLSYIAFKLIPDGLRKVFKQEWDIRYKIKLGEWKDTPKNGRDYYELESPRSRRRSTSVLMTMQNGNTAEWDSTCLYFGILFSASIGSSLSPIVRKSVDDLRQIRNYVTHRSGAGITDAEFQKCAFIVLNAFTSLGLSISNVEAIKNQRSFRKLELKSLEMLVDDVTDKLKAQAAPSITEEDKAFRPDVYSKIEPFCSLTFKPLHQVIQRSSDIKRIMEKMEATRIGSDGLVSTIYFSGIPGCGKSQLARQIGQEFFSSRSHEGPTFVGTINAETLQTIGDSYILLAKQLGIAHRTLTVLAIAMAEGPKETINHLKEIILPIVRKFSAWLIIADNVVDLTMVHSYLPETASKEWGHGQVLITTQDSSSIPTRALHTYHESLSEGMLQDDAMELLKEVSHISSQDQHAEHVAKSLGHQPLALAAAALYAQAVINRGSPKYSWSDYFKSIVQGERRPLMKMVTDESSRAVATSIKVAIDKSMETDEILCQTFTLFSVCASDYLPIQAALNFVKDRSTQSEEKIKEHLLESSSFLSVSEEDGSPEYFRLHSSVLHVLKTEVIFGLEPKQRSKYLSAASKVFLVLLDEKQKNTSKNEREYLQLRKIKSHLSSMVTIMHTNILFPVSQKVQ